LWPPPRSNHGDGGGLPPSAWITQSRPSQTSPPVGPPRAPSTKVKLSLCECIFPMQHPPSAPSNETNNRCVQDERMRRRQSAGRPAGPACFSLAAAPLRPATDWPHEFTSADLALISGSGARRFRTLQNCWAVPLSRIPSAGDGRPMFRGQ